MITKLLIIWLTVCVIKVAQAKDDNPFLAAVNFKHYVDKTGFVEYFHNKLSPVFFTAPLGFGKTTNLLMLKAFYEMNTSENGSTVNKEETDNYKAFQRVKYNAARTLMDDEKFFKSNFGSQPVIHLSFKDLRGKRTEEFMDDLKWLMIESFKAHSYLKTSAKLSIEEKALFRKFFTNDVRGYQLIENSGGTLAKLLSKHFDRPCLLLIDDFDEPTIKMCTTGSFDMDHIVQRLQIFMNKLLSDERAVNRTFLTGKTRLAGIYIPPGVKHYQFGLHADITKFFGVRETELRGLSEKSVALDQLNVPFKGFTMANSTEVIFDPVTITEFLEGRNHTRVVDSAKILKAVPQDRVGRDKIDLAMRRDPISITAPKETDHERCIVTFAMVLNLRDLYSMLELDEPDHNCLLYYLFEVGYFTVTSQVGGQLTIALPDKAAYDALGAGMQRFWLSYLGITKVPAGDFVEAFMGLTYKNASLDAFANSVVNVFNESLHRPISALDLRSPLLSFLTTRVQQYPILEIRYSEEGNDKRTCLLQAVTQRKHHSQKGVVLEFMHNICKKEWFAADVKTESLWKGFRTVKNDQDIHRLLIIGICLNKKDVFEFTFFYNSDRHKNSYEVHIKMKPWRSRRKKKRTTTTERTTVSTTSTERSFTIYVPQNEPKSKDWNFVDE